MNPLEPLLSYFAATLAEALKTQLNVPTGLEPNRFYTLAQLQAGQYLPDGITEPMLRSYLKPDLKARGADCAWLGSTLLDWMQSLRDERMATVVPAPLGPSNELGPEIGKLLYGKNYQN